MVFSKACLNLNSLRIRAVTRMGWKIKQCPTRQWGPVAEEKDFCITVCDGRSQSARSWVTCPEQHRKGRAVGSEILLPGHPAAPFRQEAGCGEAGVNEYQCACLEGGWRIWAAARAVPAGCLLWTQQSLRLGQTHIQSICFRSETTSESGKSLLFLVHVLMSFLGPWM